MMVMPNINFAPEALPAKGGAGEFASLAEMDGQAFKQLLKGAVQGDEAMLKQAEGELTDIEELEAALHRLLEQLDPDAMEQLTRMLAMMDEAGADALWDESGEFDKLDRDAMAELMPASPDATDQDEALAALAALLAGAQPASDEAEPDELTALAGQLVQAIQRALARAGSDGSAAATQPADGVEAEPAMKFELLQQQQGQGDAAARQSALPIEPVEIAEPARSDSSREGGFPAALTNLLSKLTAANSGEAQPSQLLQALQSTPSAQSLTSFTQPAAAPATSEAPGNEDVNAARLARALNTALQQQGGSLTLRLTPPDLGTVRIELQLQNTTVNAQLHTQNESARQLLTQQLAQLRAGLEAQGLTVERLGVQTMASSNANGSTLQQQADNAPGDGRSRNEYAGQGGQSHENDEQNDHQQQREQRQPQQSAFDAMLADQAEPAESDPAP